MIFVFLYIQDINIRFGQEVVWIEPQSVPHCCCRMSRESKLADVMVRKN